MEIWTSGTGGKYIDFCTIWNIWRYVGARKSRGTVILAGAGFSLFLETLQYLLAMGASDITDVINNTLGAVIGVLLWKAFRKIAGEKAG